MLDSTDLLVPVSVLTPVSTSVIKAIPLATVSSPRSVQFGAFGYCIDGVCSRKVFGYDLTLMTAQLSLGDSNVVNGATHGVSHHLTNCTKAFIMMPIGAVLALFSFFGLLDRPSSLVTLAAMIMNFVVFGEVKRHIHNYGGKASYGVGTWLTLAAVIVQILSVSCVTYTRSSYHARSAV